MAYVSAGPVSTLPGARLRFEAGATCDTEGHENRPAVVRIQGETDSFGCEAQDLCEECLAEHDAAAQAQEEANEPQYCERCHAMRVGVRPFRDPEEGGYGPVYNYCPDCTTIVTRAQFDDDGVFKGSDDPSAPDEEDLDETYNPDELDFDDD